MADLQEVLQNVIEAVETGEVAAVSKMIADYPDLICEPTADGDQILHFACWQKHSAIVDLLIEAGADVNARGDFGKTPLHYAIYEGDESSTMLVKQLLAAGASPHAKDETCEQNPLGWAVREQIDGIGPSIALIEAAGAEPDLEVVVNRNDIVGVRSLLASATAMSRERIEGICDIAIDLHESAVSAKRNAGFGLPSLSDSEIESRGQILRAISEWLRGS